jgi:uncharacterized YigZ family protein
VTAPEAEPFLTVVGRARAGFRLRGSRFVGHVAPADGPVAAEAFVEEVRAAEPDATHVVPAYRVPAADGSRLREWASDDGEPTGSAGEPALNALQGRDLRNVVVAVSREFGGVELGVGGLVRAYARATTEAVEAAGVVERRPTETVRAVVDYDDSGTVRSVLESAGVGFDADHEARVAFAARVPVDEAAALRDRLRSATSGRVELGSDGG